MVQGDEPMINHKMIDQSLRPMLKDKKIKTPVLILTKGLKYLSKDKKILTISENLRRNSGIRNISVLKGPCLAKELARKNQTSVVIANKSINFAKKIGKRISTKYYLTEFSKDVVGVEICSAIKNIYSMIIGAGQSFNASSNLFQKSILEMKYLTKYFKGKEETVLGLAGAGDLYVVLQVEEIVKWEAIWVWGIHLKLQKKSLCQTIL